MGRGVMTATDAVHVVYFPITIGSGCDDEDCCDSDFSYWEWDEFIEDLWEIIKDRYPSFFDCDKWDGREEHRILENDYARIVVCEYMGCVSVSLAIREDADHWPYAYGLADHWCRQIAGNFQKLLDAHFGTIAKLGTMSNGVSVFQKVGD